MKRTPKDYTLNGKINASTWQEFRIAMKTAGIETGTKTYEQLADEYAEKNKSSEEATTEVNITADEEYWAHLNKIGQPSNKELRWRTIMANAPKVKSATPTPKDTGVVVPAGDMSSDKYYPELQNENKYVLDAKHGDFIVKQIYAASFKATQGESKGLMVVIARRLWGIIKAAYSDKNIPEDNVRDIIARLITTGYIVEKKYESGKVIYYPTVKCRDYYNAHKEVK